MNLLEINSLVLAYIGDAYYEVLVRNYLIDKKINKVNELQKNALLYVSAKRQAYFLDKLINKDFLTEDEIQVVKRARNAKINSKPKNCDVITYKHATSFEALIGYLYLNKNLDRIKEIFEEVIKC